MVGNTVGTKDTHQTFYFLEGAEGLPKNVDHCYENEIQPDETTVDQNVVTANKKEDQSVDKKENGAIAVTGR